MTNTAPLANDLVSRAIAEALRHRVLQPVPLISTAYDIRITGGLAAVTAKRTFRNQEAQSIEATLTFPLPVHAVLYGLKARIGSRTLRGFAKARAEARGAYEDAIDRGKTAVLHEELLRGIHMLSVGHVAPGTEIEVTLAFALPLAWIGGRAILRIPTTVGDVYGHSGLPDSDELIHGGPVAAAAVTVNSDSGTPVLLGGSLDAGKARVPLDRPIDIEVMGWTPRELSGRAADGRTVTLTIAPADTSAARIDAAVLVDHSGSMADVCVGTAAISKHAAVLLGLNDAGAGLDARDGLELWEFDTSVRRIGKSGATDWRALIPQLSGPQGGTEIGSAIMAVLAGGARDILLITDGKSHALDVQSLAKSGARFTIALIGDDSLDANVGHLAALTGGEIFAAHGTDITSAVTSAFASLRAAPLAADTSNAETRIATRCAGMSLVASWGSSIDADAAVDAPTRHVAAAVAALRVPTLDTDAAARLAEAEGLVTHLTSLFLVDEDGAALEGLPATRKVPLPSPMAFATARAYAPSEASLPRFRSRSIAQRAPAMLKGSNSRSIARTTEKLVATHWLAEGDPAELLRPVAPADPKVQEFASLKHRIDWRSEATRLADGDLSGLPRDVATAIERAARTRLVVRAADRLRIDPVRLVIGLLALASAAADRSAKRVVRAILGATVPDEALRLAARFGLIDETGDGRSAGRRA